MLTPATTASSVSPPDFNICIARSRQLTPRGSTPLFGTLAPLALAITTGRAWPNGDNLFCCDVSARLSPVRNGALRLAAAVRLMKSLRLRFSSLIAPPDVGNGEWEMGNWENTTDPPNSPLHTPHSLLFTFCFNALS